MDYRQLALERRFLVEAFPQSVRGFRHRCGRLDADGLCVPLKVRQERHLRPGGTISGPSMSRLADVAGFIWRFCRGLGTGALAVDRRIW